MYRQLSLPLVVSLNSCKTIDTPCFEGKRYKVEAGVALSSCGYIILFAQILDIHRASPRPLEGAMQLKGSEASLH